MDDPTSFLVLGRTRRSMAGMDSASRRHLNSSGPGCRCRDDGRSVFVIFAGRLCRTGGARNSMRPGFPRVASFASGSHLVGFDQQLSVPRHRHRFSR